MAIKKKLGPGDKAKLTDAEQRLVDKEYERASGKKLPSGHHAQLTESAYAEWKKTKNLNGVSYMGGEDVAKPVPTKPVPTKPAPKKEDIANNKPYKPSKPRPADPVPNQIPPGRYYLGKLQEGTVELLKKRKSERDARLQEIKDSKFQPKAKTQVLSKKMGGQPVRQVASNIATTAKNIVGKAKFNREQRAGSGKTKFSQRRSS